MAARSEYLDALAAVPLFSGCSKRDLQKIARAGDELKVEDGRVLVDQGKVGREAFVILEGSATVRRSNRKVASLGPGDHFGELALLDRGPRTASVVADGPMRVLVLGSREFGGVLNDMPALAHKLLASLAGRVRELDTKAFG